MIEAPERARTETIKVEGEQLFDKVIGLIHEGNVRRVVIKQGEEIVLEFPLTVGVLGAVIAPPLAAIGAAVALLTSCTFEVERDAPTIPEEQDEEQDDVATATTEIG